MCPLRRSKRLRCTQAGSSVEGSRRQRRANGHWRIRTMERKNLVQWKEKNSTGTGKRKRTWKDGAKSSGRAKTQKTQNQCWNCWKTSRQCKDCWARPQKQSQGQSNSCRRITSYTSYLRTNDCTNNGYVTDMLEHNTMINIDTAAHMILHNTQS